MIGIAGGERAPPGRPGRQGQTMGLQQQQAKSRTTRRGLAALNCNQRERPDKKGSSWQQAGPRGPESRQSGTSQE